MTTVLDEFSIAYVAMTEWAPPLMTILLGGLLASVLFPRWQGRHARYHAREDRKLELAEELARNITRYVASWGRLRSIAELEASRPNGLTDVEFERKKGFIEARNLARDALMDTICSVEIYFSDEMKVILREFVSWDEACLSLRLTELPPRARYVERRNTIIESINREIAG